MEMCHPQEVSLEYFDYSSRGLRTVSGPVLHVPCYRTGKAEKSRLLADVTVSVTPLIPSALASLNAGRGEGCVPPKVTV